MKLDIGRYYQRSKMVVELRSNCLAIKHDSSWAYRAYRCTCPKAKTDYMSPRGWRQPEPTVVAIIMERPVYGARLADRRAAYVQLHERFPWWTQAEYAQRLGVHQRTIQRYARRLRRGA